MARTILLMGQDVLPIKEQSQLEHDVEHLFNADPTRSVVEGQFILKREQGCIALQLISNQPPQQIESRVLCALNFIHTHYGDRISLKRIARSAYMSPSYFCRCFRKEMGMSCWQYLNNFRITNAKQLLSRTDLSITRIGFDVGFTSLTHFERVFKQIEGQSPSRYRKGISQSKKVKKY